MGYPFGKYVAEKVTRQVYMTASDYAAGHEWKEAFKAGFSGAGGTIVGEIYLLLGSPDFVPYLTKIAQEGPEGLCAWFVGSDAIRFLQAYDQLGLRQKTKLLMFGGGIDYDVLPAIKNAVAGAVSPTGGTWISRTR